MQPEIDAKNVHELLGTSSWIPPTATDEEQRPDLTVNRINVVACTYVGNKPPTRPTEGARCETHDRTDVHDRRRTGMQTKG